ncbi:MAG TPA: hypothetical protein PKD86_09110, partial [Gemmatales bacterium]|nr:hypothetical protein [Gemmatales bacterium]
MSADLLRFHCAKCNSRLKAQLKHAGHSITCPKCQTRQFIPKPADSDEVDLSSAQLRKLEMFPPAGVNRPPVGPPQTSPPVAAP